MMQSKQTTLQQRKSNLAQISLFLITLITLIGTMPVYANLDKAPNGFLSVQTVKNVGHYTFKATKLVTKLSIAGLAAIIIKEASFKENTTQSRLTSLECRIPIISLCGYAIYTLIKSADNDLNKPCTKTINYLVSSIFKKLTSPKTEKTN